ncbi:plasmid maintenance protein (plasmid) [Borreliella yangtzensis]
MKKLREKMKNIKTNSNKYQHKLIVLISTLSYANSNLEQYTQSDILYYFNNNIKRNGQREVKIKTLQSYLYKLETVFRVTNNYYKHLGVNMGTEVYYKLKYPKKECYRIVNKHFKDKKKNKYKSRVNSYFEKNCIKNSNVEKQECYNNKNNNKEEKETIKKLQIKNYIKKCNFGSNISHSILNLKLEKEITIEICKIIKRSVNLIKKNIYKKIYSTKLPTMKKLKNKQKELSKILNKIKNELKNENYDSKQLKIKVEEIYKKYKNKPHFIIENNKYDDLEKIVKKLKNNLKNKKINEKEDKTDIKNNVFNILIEQLKNKIKLSILIPLLKKYLDKKSSLEYSKIFNNHYYYEILKMIESNEYYLKSKEFENNAN